VLAGELIGTGKACYASANDANWFPHSMNARLGDDAMVRLHSRRGLKNNLYICDERRMYCSYYCHLSLVTVQGTKPPLQLIKDEQLDTQS
jgi:hypothetical protein